MLRFLTGVASALLLVTAGFFLWTSEAERDSPVPPAPEATRFAAPLRPQRPNQPPAASPKSKEERRFARADKNEDGRITRDEMLQPRRKPFEKLDANRDGRLSFEEWTVKTAEKFAGADADRSGWLSPREYEASKPKAKGPPRKCAC
jgi:hypothetical protein